MPAFIQILNWILRPVPFMKNCIRKYGDWFTIRFPGLPPFVITSDPAAVKQIFAGSPEQLYSGIANRILKPTMGEHSVLLADGDTHLRLRKLMSAPLHGDRMRSYQADMQNVTQRVADGWKQNKPFAFHPEMQSITLQIIIHAVFGFKGGERFEQLKTKCAKLLDTVSNPFGILLVNNDGEIRLKPLLALPVPFSPYVQMQNLLKELDVILYAEIEERQRIDCSGRTDILSLLIESRDENNQALSPKELRDQMVTLLLAGHETTATAICWVFYRLLLHDEIRANLIKELEANDWSPDTDYLDAVIKEAMRINPVVQLVVRHLNEPLEIAGKQLPRGVVVAPCIYLTHYRSDIWDKPQDFKPERMLENRILPFEFFPFGGGVRRCIGAAFASYEMQVVISCILKDFDLKLKPGYRMKITRRGITFAPSKGLPVVVNKKSPVQER